MHNCLVVQADQTSLDGPVLIDSFCRSGSTWLDRIMNFPPQAVDKGHRVYSLDPLRLYEQATREMPSRGKRVEKARSHTAVFRPSCPPTLKGRDFWTRYVALAWLVAQVPMFLKRSNRDLDVITPSPHLRSSAMFSGTRRVQCQRTSISGLFQLAAS